MCKHVFFIHLYMCKIFSFINSSVGSWRS